jgi:hypothetical protein
MILLNSTKFFAYILSSLVLFMVVAFSAPHMYSEAARPAYASQKDTVVLQCQIR